MKTFAVVEDDTLIRQILADVLCRELKLQMIGSFSTAAESLHELPALAPDLVLVDLYLGEEDGISLFEMLREQMPTTRWLLCTAADKIAVLLRARDAGMHGIILKKSPSKDFVEAARQVLSGEPYMCPLSMLMVIQQGRGDEPDALSAEEKDVVAKIAEGFTAPDIASLFGISSRTVYGRLAKIRSKTGLVTRADIVRLAQKLGLVPPP